MSAATGRRLATVLRVAALQETVAKAVAGRAAAAVAASEQVHAQARASLADARLCSDLAAATQRRTLRAAVVTATAADVATAEQERAASLDRWSSARSRVRLFEELDARQREERRTAAEKAAQALADDLSAGRRRGREER